MRYEMVQNALFCAKKKQGDLPCFINLVEIITTKSNIQTIDLKQINNKQTSLRVLNWVLFYKIKNLFA